MQSDTASALFTDGTTGVSVDTASATITDVTTGVSVDIASAQLKNLVVLQMLHLLGTDETDVTVDFTSDRVADFTSVAIHSFYRCHNWCQCRYCICTAEKSSSIVDTTSTGHRCIWCYSQFTNLVLAQMSQLRPMQM